MLRETELAGECPISLDEVKKHCRIDDDDNDDLIQDYLNSAVELVTARTGLSLVRQSYRLELPQWWCGCLEVPAVPVRTIGAIKYFDTEGQDVTVSESDYRWYRTKSGAVIELLPSFGCPAVQCDRLDAVRIEFEAGFDDPNETGSGDDPELVMPIRAKHVVMLLVSFWYDNRDAVAAQGQAPVPMGAEALMGQLKVYR